MQRRVLAAFLAVCLLLSLTPVTALAEEDVLSSPDRYTDVSLEDAVAYLRGSGTQDDPFQIWNADDLYYINYLEYWRGQEEGEVPVYHYLEMAYIDLSSADRFDKETGYITANFAGVYDGGGHALTGMDKPLFYFTKGTYVGDGAGTVFTDYVSGESHDKVFSAIVRNLTLSEPAITQTVATDVIEQMGAVAAYAVNTAFYNIRVEGGEINGVSGAASIAGRAGCVVIDDCSSNADIYASMHRAAGIVSNLRIVDDKKGATSTSLVTNCTFSGTVSGNLDGERGSAGIVGAVYMDGTSELDNGGGLPLYVSDCTFSGTVSGTVTSGSGNFGGILGTSYLGPGLNLKNNVVTGTIENISVQGAGTAANVGGIVGKTLNYSLLGRELTLVLENNDAGQAVLPDSNPGEKLYVGTLIGCQYDANRVTTGPVSISTTESLGLYGNIQGAQFSGEIGALTLPECQGSVEFFILEGATVESLTVNTTGTLKIHNAGTLGNVTNKMGVTIADNTGTIENVTSLEGTVLVTGNQGEIGNLTSAGTITVGASAKTQETAAESVGNEGVLGDLSAAGSVTIYRNAQGAEIGSVTSRTNNIIIGQSDSSNEAVRDYNTNAGTIGSVDAGLAVYVRSVTAGSVAAGEGELVKAGSSVAIGTTTVQNANTVGDIEAGTSVSIYNAAQGSTGTVEAGTTVSIGTSALLNEGDIGSVTAGDSAGTTVTVYNGGAEIGDISAKSGSISIAANKGQIGAVDSALSSVAVGSNVKTQQNAGNAVGNEGTIESLTAGTSVTIYRNTGRVGTLDAQTSVTIGQGNNASADVRAYNVNSGSIGSVAAGTTVGIYGGVTQGSVAAGGGELVKAGSSVTIGSLTYPNYNTIGPVEAPTVSGYTFATVGEVTADSNKLVNASGDTGTVLTASGNVTLSAQQDGSISDGENTYNPGLKLVLTATATVAFEGGCPVQLSSVESNGTVTLTDADGVARIGSINAVSEVKLGLSNESFAGTVTGDITAGSNVYVGYSGAYFTGKIGGSISGASSVTIYNSGTLGAAGKSISAGTGSLTLVNGKSTGPTGMVLSDVVNKGSTGTMSITNYGTPMAGKIEQKSSGLLTLTGTAASGRQYTGDISAARALSITGSIGENSEENAVEVAFTGETAVISVSNQTVYLKVSGEQLQSVSVTSTATPATTAAKNTVDLRALSKTVSVSFAGSKDNTTLLLPDAVQAGDVGTLVGATVNATVEGDTYATGNVTVNADVSLSADGVLTLTATSPVLVNYGTIGAVNHIGTGTLTIYNVGADAKIGDVTSAGTITVGKKDVSEEMGTAGNKEGNEGVLGDLSAAGSVTIYRNAQGAEIGSVTSRTNNIIIGQSDSSNEAVRDYNTNAGTIGSVDAGLAVYVRSVTAGSVAAGEGELVKAGSSVAIGTTTVQNANTVGDIEAGTSVSIYNAAQGSTGAVEAGSSVTIGSGTLFNGGDVESVAAKGTVAIYNGEDAEIGSVDTEAGVSIYGNKGTVGDVTAGTSIGVGDSGKAESTAAGRIGNTGEVGNLAAGTSVSIYRNTGTLGDIEAKTSSVTIGQGNNASADVRAYNVNSGSIGSVSAATSVAIHSSAQGSVAIQSGQSVSAGTTVAIGSEQNANANDIGPVQCQTTSSLYNGTGSVSSLTSGGTATVYVQEGSAGLNVITTDADVKIEDRTQSSAPSVNVTTGGGDVRVARAEGDTNPILAKVNLTVTKGLLKGQTLFVRGAFASLTHKGAGDVIMESADTSVANLIKLGTGDVKEFGETGSVTTPDEAQECLLSLVPVSHDSLEVYLLSAKGLPLDKGSWSNTQVEGGVFTPAAGIVAGGGTAEKLGTVAVETAQAGELEVTVSGTYIPEQGEGMPLTVSLKVTIPALVERVDTVLLTSADEFEAAADQYAWQQTAQPQDYPVLAVMPVVSEAYSDITPTVNGQDVNEDGVLLVAVDAARALDEGVIEVQVAAQGENAPGYSQSVSYPLTEADRAKLDTQKEYYYITYRYMDGTTKDKTVPVEKGQTGETEAPGQREGYTFLGWRGDNDRLYSAGSEVTPEADMVMTAEWGADSTVYTLTISVTGGGSVVRVEDGQEHDIASGTGFLEGDQVVLRAKRATGYRFAGWTVDGESFDEEEITVTMDDNVTVKATFRRISSGGAPSGGSSGGSVTTYAIAVGSVENGTVECISKEAKGNEVLVTLTPDEGYEVGSLQVVKDSGGEVSVTKRGDGEYLFTMPGEAVRVIAAFVEAQEEADEWNNPFADVAEGAWYYDAVAYASQNGLMNGVSADSFAPDATTSRGMIVTILYRLEDSPSAAQADFADVAAGAYYAGAVAWASANGIVTGYGDGTFGPDTAITREQLAAILYRYAQYLGLEVSQTADLTGYGDAADISEWAQQAFAWAVREGLISGMDDGTLAPRGTATRAQVATILMRLCEKLEG